MRSYLSAHNVRSSTDQWQALFIAVAAMDMPRVLLRIPSRISDLRCGKQFQNVHNRKSSRRCWRLRGSVRRSLSHRIDNNPPAASAVHWPGNLSLCPGTCRRPNYRRRFGCTQLEVVLSDQPSGWSSDGGDIALIFPSASKPHSQWSHAPAFGLHSGFWIPCLWHPR